VDRQLVGEVPALRDLDRVDLADEIGDGDVGRRELLAVALIGREPDQLDGVTVVRDPVLAGGADRLERIVVDLASGDRGQHGVEQRDERARDTRLRLATLAEEDDVLAGEDRVLDLGHDGLLVADDPFEEGLLARERDHEIRTQLFLHGAAAISALAKRSDGHGTVGGHERSPSFRARASLGRGYHAILALQCHPRRHLRPRSTIQT